MASTVSMTRASVAAPRRIASRAANVRGVSPIKQKTSRSSLGRFAPATRGGAVRCRAVDLRHVIERLCAAENLTADETEEALDALIDADPAQISAFLVLMRAKGESPEEMAGMARAMRARAVTVDAGNGVLDIVGTGGDDAGTVNISTGSCILAAAAGAKVAKHGNRSVSSMCGSADVLEALGVAVDLGPEGVAECIKQTNMGFMFAPRYHPAMKAVVPVRKVSLFVYFNSRMGNLNDVVFYSSQALKVRTAFNMLGPMLNPAGTQYALVGVYTPDLQPLMADSLMALGMKKALVVCSTVGDLSLDEMTPCGPTNVVEVTPAGTKAYSFDPKDVGIPPCELSDLAGGDAKLNAQMLTDALGGEKGPVADCLMLNAGVAMAAADQAASVEEGVAMCKEAHAQGRAGDTLRNWIELSQKLRAQEA